MKELQPTSRVVIVEQILRSETEQKDAASRIPGFVLSKPEYQGRPIQGTVFALHPSEEELKVGDEVIFFQEPIKGFKWEGKKLLPIQRKNIAAVVK